jgi:cytochrome c553
MTTIVRAIAALGLVFVAWLLGGSTSRDEVVRAPIVRLAVRHPWLIAGTLAAGGVIVAAVVLISGVVPIKASSGHWAITAALLDFAKVRAVSTHAWGIEVPPLEDEALILKGAGHYEQACLPCHGGPGRSLPPIMAAMTPSPPVLMDRVTRWTPAELFVIVKDGIKFTGMPAWPVPQREDEVWAMVAFLRRMPRLDAAAYRALVGDNARRTSPDAPVTGSSPSPTAVSLCGNCHGLDGTGRGSGAFPSLAGQRAEYLYASLRAFAERQRFSAVMSGIAANLDDDGMRGVAEYYASLSPREGEPSDDASARARGAAIASRGVSERDVPACVECHGPTAQPKNPAYPRLSGQHAMYLVQQLQLLQERRRGGSVNVALMHVFVDRLRHDEIRDVARFYSSAPSHADTTSRGALLPSALVR